MPELWRRRPADRVRHGAGADPKDPDTPRRTTRTASDTEKKAARACFEPARTFLQPITRPTPDRPPDSRMTSSPSCSASRPAWRTTRRVPRWGRRRWSTTRLPTVDRVLSDVVPFFKTRPVMREECRAFLLPSEWMNGDDAVTLLYT